MNKILGIGNALIDALVQIDSEQLLEELELPKGSMQLIDRERFASVSRRLSPLAQKRTTGGSACNTIRALAHMGTPTALIGRVGSDELSTVFADNCKACHIEAHLVHDQELPTGVATTLITPDGQRTFGTYLGAAAQLTAADLRTEWFDGCGYFYIEGYLVQNHALIRRAVRLAHEAGLQVCLDLASYNVVEAEREFFAELLAETDIVFANEYEACAFTGEDDPLYNLETLSSLCGIAVVKVGKRGVYVRRGDEQTFCEAREVPHVVDTTAAGDYFSAGFLHALASGGSLHQCAQLGSLLAGHIIEVVGTALDEPTWQKLRQSAAQMH